MIAAIEVYIACRTCGTPARYTTPNAAAYPAPYSGDGACWTDGYVSPGPVPPRYPVVRCAGCDRFYWMRDAMTVGADGHGCAALALSAAPLVHHLSATECFHALAMGVANTRDREITLRILAWWAANDSLRTIGDIRPTRHVAPALIRNLVRLVQLLDGERPTHRLLAADARRQMGHFAAVRATLGSPLMFGSPSLAHAAESIALLADHEIASPRRLRPTATRWHRLVAYPVTQFRIA